MSTLLPTNKMLRSCMKSFAKKTDANRRFLSVIICRQGPWGLFATLSLMQDSGGGGYNETVFRLCLSPRKKPSGRIDKHMLANVGEKKIPDDAIQTRDV